MQDNEKVLAFLARLLGQRPFQGVLKGDEAQAVIAKVLDPKNLYFLPREDAEQDPSWKQVIPYIVVKKDGHYLSYARSKMGGEGRLFGKRSIGLGGHINPVDGHEGHPLAYDMGFFRELHEEAGILLKNSKSCRETIIGVINDDSDEVGKVHFGVVHVLVLPPDQTPLMFDDPAVFRPAFHTLSDLRATMEQYENWSRLTLPSLLDQENRQDP